MTTRSELAYDALLRAVKENCASMSENETNDESGTGSTATPATKKASGVSTPLPDTPPGSAVDALITLTIAELSRASERPIYNIGRACGILKYLIEVVYSVDPSNLVFERTMLEGTELANVYSQLFDGRVADVYYLSLHEENPEHGGEELLPRKPMYMVDLSGEGELVNISDLHLDVAPIRGAILKYLGMWDQEQEGTLLDYGTFQIPVEIKEPQLSFSAGMLRSKDAL